MQKASPYTWMVILVSLMVALLLSIMPLPSTVSGYRPAWLLLVIIYWAIYAPTRVGISVAWLSGLLLDVLQGTLLGEYALLTLLTAYLIGHLHRRLTLFPLLQQCVFILLFLSALAVIVVWIQGFSGQSLQSWQYAGSVVSSVLVWPLVRHLLGRYRRARI